MKDYQIRYNTDSKDDSTSWRLISDGKEILVSNIFISSKTKTTKNFITELNSFKYHINCTGNLEVRNNVAYITDESEKSVFKKHILKTISYRLLSTSLLITTTYTLGMDIKLSALIGFGELLIKPVLYFLHERVWHKLGRKK